MKVTLRRFAPRAFAVSAVLGAAVPMLSVPTLAAEPQLAVANLTGEQAVGRLYCGKGSDRFMSTATLIENSTTILAASHFNYWEAKDRVIPVGNCEFQLLSEGGSVVFRSGVEVVKRGGEPSQMFLSRATDWAVLRLKEPAPADRHPLEVATNSAPSAYSDAYILGYSLRYHRMEAQYFERSCNARPTRAGSIVLTHSCTTAPGMSGAPLISLVGGEPKLVALHSARESDLGVAVGIGGFAARTIAQIRDGSLS